MDRATLLSDAGMSIRGTNALAAEGTVTVGDLHSLVLGNGIGYLKRVPNFGRISFDQATAILSRLDPVSEVKLADMALRDWFAGQALAALIAKAPLFDRDGEFGPPVDMLQFKADMAESAYFYADAMLAARKGGAA